MVTDKLVTLKTAKLAKEKRFTWTCYHVFSDGLTEDIYWKNSYAKRDANNYARPTQGRLAKWLRERKGIVVSVDIDDTLTYFITITFLKGGKYMGAEHYGEYKTYEQALEAGLQDALDCVGVIT